MIYEVEISINAENREELQDKLLAIQVINEKLTADEIIGLAYILENKPTVMEIIRPFLTSDKDITLMDVMKMTPSIFNKLKQK